MQVVVLHLLPDGTRSQLGGVGTVLLGKHHQPGLRPLRARTLPLGVLGFKSDYNFSKIPKRRITWYRGKPDTSRRRLCLQLYKGAIGSMGCED